MSSGWNHYDIENNYNLEIKKELFKNITFKKQFTFDTLTPKIRFYKPIEPTKTLIPGEELLSSWYLKDSRLIRKRFFIMVKVLKNLSKIGTRDRRLKLIEEYTNKLMKRWNDHKNVLINDHTEPSILFEPYDLQLVDNTVTFDGLTRMAEIFTNQSVEFFTYLEIGESSFEVDKLNGALGAPLSRVNVLDLGWFEPKGNTIQTGSMFPEDTQGGLISEAGAFDQPVGGKMWWRVLIEDSNKRVETIGGVPVPSVAHIHMLKAK